MNALNALHQQRELVRYATLAPSSHNTQCWKFRLGDERISILPDTSRRCPAVDPDDHHLYVSLGCAAENLVQAANASGLHSAIVFDAQTDSPGIAVFVSETSDKAHWIEAGRCYARFALQATTLGIRNAMLNQPVEVAGLRPQFASYLGLTGGRPDPVVRFGRGPETPRSLRRTVDAFLT